MAFILNIETATKNCSVSLAKEGNTIALAEISSEHYSHAEKLHIFIEDVIRQGGIKFSDLEAVAVSKGPGSYTGLRIGVSAAKGLCYALGIPLIAVDTLEILARQLAITERGVILPMIDARRMEVYNAVFDQNYFKIEDTAATIITEDSFKHINDTIYLLGDGILKCKDILTDRKFIFHEHIVYPSAKEMSVLSYNKYKISDIEDVAYFEPFYLKDFILNK